MTITDAQAHVWEVDKPERPWPAKPPRPVHRENGYSAEELLTEMDAIGVDRAVLVPPSWVGENNATVLEAAAKYPGRFGVIGRFNAKAEDAKEKLANWLKQPHVLGIRMTFHIQPHSGWLDDGSLDWYWADCERLQLLNMALVPGMARRLEPVLAKHPDLRIVIPHMGYLLDERGAAAFAQLDEVLALARYPRVCVMTSCAPTHSAEAFPYGDIEVFIKKIYDTFGPRRMFWGADITRLTSTYRECLEHMRSLPFLSSDDKEWILGKSLEQVYGWPAS